MTMGPNGSFAAAFVLLLTACSTAPPQPSMPRPVWKSPEPLEIGSATDIREYLPDCRPNPARDCVNPAYVPAIRDPLSIAEATQVLAGATYRSYSSSHGTQVTYFAHGGEVFLWYPGNERVLAGRWKVALYQDLIGATPVAEQMRAYHAQVAPLAPIKWFDRNYLCFQYANAFNPVMWPGAAQRWECVNVTEYVRLGTVQREVGDLFDLASRREVPFVIPRGENQDLDFQTLQQRMAPTGGG